MGLEPKGARCDLGSKNVDLTKKIGFEPIYPQKLGFNEKKLVWTSRAPKKDIEQY